MTEHVTIRWTLNIWSGRVAKPGGLVSAWSPIYLT